MAAVYPRCRARFEQAQIDLLTDTIKAAMTSTGYNSGHEYLSSLSVIGTAVTLTAKTVAATDGMFDAADVSFAAATGTVNAIVIYKDTGTPATSPLIAHIDTLAGIPVSLSAETLTVVWPATGILYI